MQENDFKLKDEIRQKMYGKNGERKSQKRYKFSKFKKKQIVQNTILKTTCSQIKFSHIKKDLRQIKLNRERLSVGFSKGMFILKGKINTFVLHYISNQGTFDWFKKKTVKSNRLEFSISYIRIPGRETAIESLKKIDQVVFRNRFQFEVEVDSNQFMKINSFILPWKKNHRYYSFINLI